MLTPLNRKELTVTYSLKEQARIRDILSANGIDYNIKTLNTTSPSPMTAGRRAILGNFGIDQSVAYEYKIYVKKDELERARYLIRK